MKTTNEKREAIRIKVVEAIPSIKSLPSYPYNPDVAKAIIELERIIARNQEKTVIPEYVVLHLDAYEKQKQADYVRMLQNNYEGRPINALDILRALGKCYAMDSNGKIFKLTFQYTADFSITDEIDLSQNLNEWSDDTIDKLYELFYE